jgi:hypothetical protein
VPDKTLNHVEEVLSGKRYKFLDPTRKAVLMLPPNALKLWLTYWMFESDEQEAYPSLDKLEEVMDTGRQAILSARQYLLDTGWLVKLTGSAAERYAKPSQGSHNVAVYRVDDPTKGVEDGGMKITPLKIIPNVTTVSAPASTGTTTGATTSTNACTAVHTLGGSLKISSLRSEEKPEEQNQEQKQKTMRVSSATKWMNRYGVAMPDGFNSWSQLDRSTWVDVHDQTKTKVLPVPEKVKDSVPVETKVPVPSASLTPPSSAPPPKLTPDEEIDCEMDWRESWGFSRMLYLKDSFTVAQTVAVTKEHKDMHREIWIEDLERKAVRG